MTADSSNSRPLIPGVHGSPDEITAENLHCIPIDWNYEENRPWLASEVTDSAFHIWITRMFPTSVEDMENQAWPVERRVEHCNRLWQDGEIWGVTYVNTPTQQFDEERTMPMPQEYKGAILATSLQLTPGEGPHAGIVSTFTAWNVDEQLYSHSDAPDALPEHVTASSIWEAASQIPRVAQRDDTKQAGDMRKREDKRGEAL